MVRSKLIKGWDWFLYKIGFLYRGGFLHEPSSIYIYIYLYWFLKKSNSLVYTIKSDIWDDDSIVSIFGSRKSGEPIVEVTKCSYYIDTENYDLFVYHPNSEQIDHIAFLQNNLHFLWVPTRKRYFCLIAKIAYLLRYK